MWFFFGVRSQYCTMALENQTIGWLMRTQLLEQTQREQDIYDIFQVIGHVNNIPTLQK